ncbi:MAG: substrate-binding domain-containing protein, partial [Ruminococcus sp.]|nr:substrate-binding domain-containing protein [Ruminococcus sp.]
ISIAGYDGIHLSKVLHPRLTTFEQDTNRIGAEAARLLIALIRKEITEDAPTAVVDGRFIEGSSVKNINR